MRQRKSMYLHLTLYYFSRLHSQDMSMATVLNLIRQGRTIEYHQEKGKSMPCDSLPGSLCRSERSPPAGENRS